MDQTAVQQVRTNPLFANLTDEQLECIAAGKIIDVPAGTVLVKQGELYPFFFVVLEGEIRISRTYDRQEILMGVIKPGKYSGETTLLLDIPWMAAARVSKPAKLFQLNEEDFWRMLSNCRTVAREIFRMAANKMRNMEGYSQQREKLALPRIGRTLRPPRRMARHGLRKPPRLGTSNAATARKSSPTGSRPMAWPLRGISRPLLLAQDWTCPGSRNWPQNFP